MTGELSPAARALLALETIQNRPGITARALGERLGVTERAARRYVAILREADLPIESVSGPAGGYRVGRGLRLPPLMFTAAEAAGLVMAVLEGHRGAADPADLVGGALAKIVRALPARVAGSIRAAGVPAPGTDAPGSACRGSAAGDTLAARVSPELADQVIGACAAGRRLRVSYRLERDGVAADRTMELDPWAVVLRHSRWYLLGWSHTSEARRVLRLDRIAAIAVLERTFTPPAELDALRTLEQHLAEGWTYPVDVLIDAPPRRVERWLPRSLGRLEADGDDATRLRAATDDPDWYARKLAALPVRFEVTGSAELRRAVTALGQRLTQAGQASS